MPWFWGNKKEDNINDDEKSHEDDDDDDDDDDDETSEEEDSVDEEEDHPIDRLDSTESDESHDQIKQDTTVSNMDMEKTLTNVSSKKESSSKNADGLVAAPGKEPVSSTVANGEEAKPVSGSTNISCKNSAKPQLDHVGENMECKMAVVEEPDNPQAIGKGGANPQDDEEEDHEVGELVMQGAIPEQVSGQPHDLALSVLTHEGMDESSLDEPDDASEEEAMDSVDLGDKIQDDDDDDEDDDNEMEMATTLQDKRSLLLLAAEHDRVDILNTIMNSNSNGGSTEDAEKEKATLLHDALPPLHVAVLYGSINAINCLLRVGADPSIRPNLEALTKEQIQSVPHAKKFIHGATAWEMVFGRANDSESKNTVLDLPLSKKESIRHAFSAEALRCIGSDEVTRLQHLLDAGVPPDLDMCGKSLYDWSVEMDATRCQAALKPNNGQENKTQDPIGPQERQQQQHKTHVLDRPRSNTVSEEDSIPCLENKLEELESLARALSTCLDNLAEEVSVCHGLLLMGGGAAALAAHVRSLKSCLERKMQEFERLQQGYENSLDELAYWMREAGPNGNEITQNIKPGVPTPTTAAKPIAQNGASSNESDDNGVSPQKRRSYLLAQIVSTKNKVHKLRVSIGDLSEENCRDLAEVERRGLTGGITLVRNLRDDIREVDFQISLLKSEEAACRAKTTRLQQYVLANPKPQPPPLQEPVPMTPTPTLVLPPPSESESCWVTKTEIHTNNGDNPTVLANEPAAPQKTSPLVQPLGVYDQPQTTTETAPVGPTTNDKSREINVADPNHVSPLQDAAVTSESRGLLSAQTPQNGGRSPAFSDPHGGTDSSQRAEQQSTGPMSDSQRIATGQSTAIAVSRKGGQGYFPTSLWIIFLRIIGIRDPMGTRPPPSRDDSTLSNSSNRNRNAQPVVII